MERLIPIGKFKRAAGQRNQGFTYIGVLIIVAVMMMALGAASEIWHSVMQREKERELLFIGHQFRAAIGNYYQKSGGRYPPNLEALVESKEMGVKKAHFLRKLYIDPMTGDNRWGLLASPDGKIAGVHSLSDEKPFKINGFIDADKALEKAEKYSDWNFVFVVKAPNKTVGGTVNGIARPEPRPK